MYSTRFFYSKCDKCFGMINRRKLSSSSKIISEAEKLVGYSTSFLSLRCLLSDELANIAGHIRKLVGTKHPLLKTAKRLLNEGQHNLQMWGLLVLLVSKAAGGVHNLVIGERMTSGIYPRQRTLAEITELIHTAHIIHRGIVNLNQLSIDDGPPETMDLGNRVAVLTGDYLLANASTALASLNNTHVVESISKAISDLATSEFMRTNFTGSWIETWKKFTYLSSASLLAHACHSAVLLGGHSQNMQQLAFNFGQNLVFARKVNDEIRSLADDSSEDFDMTSIPFAFYYQNSSSTPDTLRRLTSDKNQIRAKLKEFGVCDESAKLSFKYRDGALKCIREFPASDARTALENIANSFSLVK